MADRAVKRIPWLRVFVEGVVIVASILFAFAIDAWWAGRLVLEEEETDLARVAEEFETDRRRMAGFQALHASGAQGTLGLIELVEGRAAPTETLLVSDTLLMTLFMVPTFELQSPTAEALMRSGRIFVIRNLRIRQALAAWDRSLRHAQELEQRARSFSDDQLLPALAKRGAIGHVVRSTRLGGRAIEALDPNGMTALQVDEELAVLLSQRYATAGGAARSLGIARDWMDSVLVAIDSANPR